MSNYDSPIVRSIFLAARSEMYEIVLDGTPDGRA